MTASAILVGGGEHGRVVAEAARASGMLVAGIADPDRCAETERRLGIPWIGDDEQMLSAPRGGCIFLLGVGAIGASAAREAVVARYLRAGVVFATVIHPAALISETARIGQGSVVLAGAVLNSGAAVGNHCVVNTGAILEHDVVLGDFSQAGPAAALGGGATVGRGAYLGLGCRVRDHVAIGDGALVAMGAVVVRDVPARWIVVGVPARRLEKGSRDG